MKKYMGFVPLQVGVLMWSAQFIMLVSIMVLRLICDEFYGTLGSYFMFMCVVLIIVCTWTIAFKGCYSVTLNLIIIAKYMWVFFLFLWVVCSTWSLFFADITTDGFTCLNGRCIPTCYLIMFHDDWLEHKTDPNNVTFAKSSKRQNPPVKEIKKITNTSHKENNNSINNQIKNKISTSSRTSKIAEKESRSWNVHSPIEFDDNGIINYVYSSAKRSTHNNLKNLELNDKNAKKYDDHSNNKHPAELTRAILHGTYIKCIGVPTIFLGIFIYSLLSLSDYASELEYTRPVLPANTDAPQQIANLC